MDISSTTTTSYGSRLSAWCRNRPRLLGSQPSSRCSVPAERSATRATSSGSRRLARVGQRLRQPGGGLAGRCGQRDPRRSPGLVAEHGEHLGDRGGLAGARPAGQHGDPLPGADLGRPPLQILLVRAQSLAGEQAVERGGQPVVVHGGRGCGAAVDELATDRLLLPPVALQVEVPGHQPQRAPVGSVRAVGERAAAPAAVEPGGGLGPRQIGDLEAFFGRLEHVVGDGGQVDADRAEAQRADRERQGQRDGLVDLAGDPGDRGRRVDIREVEHPGGVEGGQQTGRPGGQRRLRGGRAHRGPRSSRSESSVISADGGRQLNTPAGTPATRGVSGPAMPAQEQVERATEMPLRVVVGQPPAQHPVQGDLVEQRLQRIVRRLHRCGHRRRGVVGHTQLTRFAAAEPVGLVVHDEIAPVLGRADPQHRVDAAGEIALQRLVGQRRVAEQLGIAGQQIVGRQMAGQQRGEIPEPYVGAGSVATRQRQLEGQLAQSVGGTQIGQRPIVGQRTERSRQTGQQRLGQRLRRQVAVRQAGQRIGGRREGGGGQVVRGGVQHLQHGVHGGTEVDAAGQIPHGRQQLPARVGGAHRGVGAGWSGRLGQALVVLLHRLGLAADSGGRDRPVGGGGQRRVGRAPPRRVEQPVEASGPSASRGAAGKARRRVGGRDCTSSTLSTRAGSPTISRALTGTGSWAGPEVDG